METIKLPNEVIDTLGDIYRKLCGQNDVLLTADLKPFTFEDFLLRTPVVREAMR